MPDWIDLGTLEDFPDGAPVLKKHDGHRFVCVRRGGSVDALDDRCPHQGYPLSQGIVSGGVLTCAWHNWKFDVKTGGCTFGGEPVRHYPVRLEDGRVHLDRAVDVAKEVARLEAGVAAAMFDDDTARALREALRLGAFVPGPEGLGALGAGFALVAADGAARAEYGFDHGLAVLADLLSFAERGFVGVDEAFVQAAHAVAEPSRRLIPRRVPDAANLAAIEDPRLVDDALVAERRDEAEARVRALAARSADDATRALLPFVSRHVLDYGHGAIFLAKARELATRFPAARAAIFGASALELAWATADTSLPPFAATRAALEQVDARGESAARDVGFDRAAFERAVLEGERSAVGAAVRLLGDGVAPEPLLRAIAHAAATRLFRFDDALELRADVDIGVLDVTHTVTYAESILALAPLASPRELARLVVLAAGFVGKVRRADAAKPREPGASSGGGLLGAVARRDLGAALAAVHGLDARGRAEAYRELAPFCALDAAVRPILYAHTVKNLEALRRLDAADPEADGGYLDALLAFVTPVRPETRPRRTAAIARKFLADGRPPEGLY
jgi:nitrite reductase/ring-hydroxylating ferredoxin subunit